MSSRFKPDSFLGVRGVGVCLLLAAWAGCSQQGPTDPETMPSTPSGTALFTLITQTDPYQDWAQFPNLEGTIASDFPHGPMARIFVNAKVEDALAEFSGSLAGGAIIVKENLGESTAEKSDELTIMWKVAGFDPGNNDWFWANITPDGEVNAEGKVDGCISCHSGARNNDFVFVHQF